MNNEEAVKKYWQAWNDRDTGALLAILAPEFMAYTSMNPQGAGKELIGKGFEMFGKTFPDLKEEIVSIVSENDIVACEVNETATFKGALELPGRTIPPTNQSYKIPMANFFRFNAQGLITQQNTYWDTAIWFKQIAIDPKLFRESAEK
jgi:steroid delta-isomerase-like uncharacterized protein